MTEHAILFRGKILDLATPIAGFGENALTLRAKEPRCGVFLFSFSSDFKTMLNQLLPGDKVEILGRTSGNLLEASFMYVKRKLSPDEIKAKVAESGEGNLSYEVARGRLNRYGKDPSRAFISDLPSPSEP